MTYTLLEDGSKVYAGGAMVVSAPVEDMHTDLTRPASTLVDDGPPPILKQRLQEELDKGEPERVPTGELIYTALRRVVEVSAWALGKLIMWFLRASGDFLLEAARGKKKRRKKR